MKMTAAFFAASRYWTDREELERTCQALRERHAPLLGAVLILDGVDLDALGEGEDGTLLIVPMSGAVQAHILQAAGRFDAAVLFPAYVAGNAEERHASLMMKNNAAPTLMDCWAVLRKTHPRALLALNEPRLSHSLRLLGAYFGLRSRKLILIGETEPWVISVSRDVEAYTRLGIAVDRVLQQEVADLYATMGEEEGAALFGKYAAGACAVVEPTERDVRNASRMAAALLRTLENHRADGLAIACFNLLSLGTTSCLGVSYINDCTDKIAACEGDLDSAVTMLMMRSLTETGLWMANPALHPDGLVNFSHCTAPLAADGATDCPYCVRSHHESGIGASLEVELPGDATLTACRISGRWGTFTAQRAQSQRGEREEGCRTQLLVRFDDFNRYLSTSLGCHQVFCFDDIREDFACLARWMGLKPEEPSGETALLP